MATTAEKTITLCLADRPDEIRQVSIANGTTCAEALELAGLDPAKTRVANRGTIRSNSESLYHVVEDGDRVLVAIAFLTI